MPPASRRTGCTPSAPCRAALCTGCTAEVFSVNSCHHQAVETPAPGFEATAFSEGGVIEAMRHTSLPVWGVQFHPERMCGAWARPDTVDGAALFAWFLRQCGGA